jgi:hypothetical protein
MQSLTRLGSVDLKHSRATRRHLELHVSDPRERVGRSVRSHSFSDSSAQFPKGGLRPAAEQNYHLEDHHHNPGRVTTARQLRETDVCSVPASEIIRITPVSI